MSQNLLIILNFFLWFAPIAFYKKLSLIYISIVSYLFSSSYWFDILLTIVFGSSFSVVVQEDYISLSLVYSCFAAVALHSGIFILFPREMKLADSVVRFANDKLKKLPGRRYVIIIKLALNLLLCYFYLESFGYIGAYGRIEFQSLGLFWYSVLVPLVAVGYAYLIFLEYSCWGRVKASTFLSLYLYVFLYGYAGARRDTVMIVAALLVVLFLRKFVAQKNENKSLVLNIVLLVILINFLAFGRSFSVGWGWIADIGVVDFDVLSALLKVTLAPMPTVHVNTLMLQYVESYGSEGYGSYITSILNTIFPRFIFGDYLFGAPLSMRLHRDLGWSGLDFGFMAEAIYSGGLVGNVMAHFIFGLFIGFAGRRAKRGDLLFVILMMGILFGIVQSLRSDSMNLMKTIFYPTLLLYGASLLTRLRLRSRAKNSY